MTFDEYSAAMRAAMSAHPKSSAFLKATADVPDIEWVQACMTYAMSGYETGKPPEETADACITSALAATEHAQVLVQFLLFRTH